MKEKRIDFRLSKELHKHLKGIAKKRREAMAVIIREALVQYIANEGKTYGNH